MRAPFAPLVPGADDLVRAPAETAALRARMAVLYGVDAQEVLPVRGRLHAIELVFRRAVRDGVSEVCGEASPDLARLAAIYGLETGTGGGIRIVCSPGEDGSPVLDAAHARDLAARRPNGCLIVDESAIEFSGSPSLAECVADVPNLAVIRSLELAYGLAGAPCGAIIANRDLCARLAEMLEPQALPAPLLRLAEAVLSPSRAAATEARMAEVAREKHRVALALGALAGTAAEEIAGPWLLVKSADPKATRQKLAVFGIEAKWLPDGRLSLTIGDREWNDRALAAFGAPQAAAGRRAEIVRDTKETRIAALVDLEAPGPVRVSTGIGFYDHMLEQVAAHGGFSLTLACDGDLRIDPHHTIEDCALALGAALRKALGDRRGIARFGFVLPMDEAEAKISLDLGGRPYAVFDGNFADARIGEYPTEMTAHVFRSLAESLGAAIHIEVKGGNDHHKTEACFKAFGRALRQAIRIEGSQVPSTKGVIA